MHRIIKMMMIICSQGEFVCSFREGGEGLSITSMLYILLYRDKFICYNKLQQLQSTHLLDLRTVQRI